MIKRMLMWWLLVPIVAHAIMSEEEILSYQAALSAGDAYITSNGEVINIMLPLDVLYQGQTIYFEEKATAIVDALEQLVVRSNGRVQLQGLVNQERQNHTIVSSAVYAQVSHLSEHLLSKIPEISYAPITVKAYEKNRNHGIWRIYPEDETFLSVTLIID